MLRKGREEWKTYKNVFDKFTDETLIKLQAQGQFDEILSPLKVGKESNVFVATKGSDKVIIKIYRMMNANFNKMHYYLSQDPRFGGLRKNKRDTILAWVQREYRNLMIAREHCRVPTPFAHKNHVLIMEYIGSKDVAPQLKDVDASDDFLDLLIVQVRKLWHNARLVHGDLSSFNILYDEGVPVLIDFSQATPTFAINADELLVRDIGNIAKFFNKDAEELLKKIKSPE